MNHRRSINAKIFSSISGGPKFSPLKSTLILYEIFFGKKWSNMLIDGQIISNNL